MTDITRKRGDTYSQKFIIKSKTTGLVIDITGYSFLLTVDPEKYPVSNANNLFQIIGTITDAAAGEMEYPFTTSEADNLGKYFFDAQLTDDAGKIRTFDAGKFKFIQDVTK